MDGSSTYHSHIFVRKDSGIKGVKDLKGKVMAYVDKATTAGYIFPVAYLRDNGVADIDNFFSEHFFTGSHDAAIFAVLDGRADVGAVKNTVYDALCEVKSRVDRELMIITESLEVPSNGLYLKSSIDYYTTVKFKKALLGMDKDPEGMKIIHEFGAKRFIETTDDDLNNVFVIIKKAGIDLSTFDYKSN